MDGELGDQDHAMISMRQLLDHAAENDYGVPAFNVNNLEQMRAIMEAADKTDSLSLCRRLRVRDRMPRSSFSSSPDCRGSRAMACIPVCSRRDHGASPAVCGGRSIGLYFTMMMDAHQ